MSTIQKSASLPIVKFPLFILSILAGLQVNASIIVFSLIDPLWNSSKDKDSKVSTPDDPVAALLKVNLFCSSSSGLWSDTITSIVLLFKPSIRDSLSSSVLRGGDNFKKVLKSPMSFSFNERLLIDTPQVNFKNCIFD